MNVKSCASGSITLNQGSYIFGLDNTSPAFASAVENAVPAVTFLMAALLRQVKLVSLYVAI